MKDKRKKPLRGAVGGIYKKRSRKKRKGRKEMTIRLVSRAELNGRVKKGRRRKNRVE